MTTSAPPARNSLVTCVGSSVRRASVRGSLALERAVRAWALLQGRDHVVPEDVEELFLPVLGHRVIFSTPFLVELRRIGRSAALERFQGACLERAPRPDPEAPGGLSLGRNEDDSSPSVA